MSATNLQKARARKERMLGSEAIIRSLEAEDVTICWGIPGGAILPLYDAFMAIDHTIEHVLVRHEQGAGHMAQGYARATGKVGVCIATSGPGATNLVTPIADAFLDSTPLVAITGQVPTHLIGNDAFQEADTTGITRPCSKHNYLVKDVNKLARVMHEAFHVATSGRPGPVVIDLPKDVLFAKGPYVGPESVRHRSYNPRREPDAARIAEAVELLANAKRPIVYGGGGIINSGPEASRLVTEFVRRSGFPCTLTLMGLGAVPASDPHFLGMLGMHGSYEANMAMHDCDVMIAIGSRFDDRVTGRLSAFSPNSRKIHIDIDPSSINKNVRVDVPIVGDVAATMRALLAAWNRRDPALDRKALASWWEQIEQWRGRKCFAYAQGADIIKPQYAVERLFELTRDRETFITTEVGQHQMWAAQLYRFEKPNRWMTSGGLGTMGYGLPAAMGVQLAHPDALVVDVAGEASILMNIQELSTIVQYRLPVKAFILNNRYMGMVRQWQELLHGNRYSESYMDALPDFVKLAEAFGCVGLRCAKPGDLDGVIREMIANKRPTIVDVAVDEKENCFPMIPSGAAHNEMILGPGADGKPGAAVSEEGMVLV
jgi:acetolactate synthase-1/2/3 large subunit